MCKLSIHNMLKLALMSVIQNKHLPKLESRRYAVAHSQHLCQELYRSVVFSPFFFTAARFRKGPDFRAISKPMMDIF